MFNVQSDSWGTLADLLLFLVGIVEKRGATSELRNRAVLVGAALVLAVCANGRDPSSCVETRYNESRLLACGSTMTFSPGGPRDVEQLGVVASFRLPPSMVGVLRHAAPTGRPYTRCKSTRVPEGLWTVCDGGFSRLERDD